MLREDELNVIRKELPQELNLHPQKLNPAENPGGVKLMFQIRCMIMRMPEYFNVSVFAGNRPFLKKIDLLSVLIQVVECFDCFDAITFFDIGEFYTDVIMIFAFPAPHDFRLDLKHRFDKRNLNFESLISVEGTMRFKTEPVNTDIFEMRAIFQAV